MNKHRHHITSPHNHTSSHSHHTLSPRHAELDLASIYSSTSSSTHHWIPSQTRNDRTKGFTLIELLIVIVVIAILTTIAIVAYNGIQNRAKTAKGEAIAKQFMTKMKMFRAVQEEKDDAYIGGRHIRNDTYRQLGSGEDLPMPPELSFASIRNNLVYGEAPCGAVIYDAAIANGNDKLLYDRYEDTYNIHYYDYVDNIVRVSGWNWVEENGKWVEEEVNGVPYYDGVEKEVKRGRCDAN